MLVPQTPPLLLLDEVVVCEPSRVVARRRFPEGDPVFAGHFPGNPIVPGVILIAGMLQALASWADGGVCVKGIERARFRRPVVPGDEVVFEVDTREACLNDYLVTAKASVGEARAVDAVLLIRPCR